MIIWADGVNGCGWLVSCRRQEMLTQGSAEDPKCKLNISSFLTLPCPLEWVTYAKDIMIIVLLLHMMGEWEGWGGGGGVHLCQGLVEGTGGGWI